MLLPAGGDASGRARRYPGIADRGPDSAVEVGVKFQSDVAGSITGIRFYKATANTGTHVGNLWSSAGTLLGSITFSNETASGWQQMLLGCPGGHHLQHRLCGFLSCQQRPL